MTIEADTPPPANTFRRMLWETVVGFSYIRAYWGRRLYGATMGLIPDAIAEGVSQAIYARLPGHVEQAADSLAQVGKDRDLYRFRGETDANWLTRVQEAWDDYEQGGTPQQMLKVINQWGNAGWPATWPSGSITLTESVDPAVFEFTLTVAYGLISPPWPPWVVGDGSVVGEAGLYIGVGRSTDISTLLYLVKKWKPSRSVGLVNVYYSVSDFVTFTTT